MRGGLNYMLLIGKKIGFALTGSFCTFEKTIPQISKLIEEGAEVLPIMSSNTYDIDTRFGKAKEFIDKIEDITGKKIIHTIEDSEPIGPQRLTDVMIIAPCTRKYNSAKLQME
jgi:dipicolinate synthase subunit B